ncbi:Sparc-related modular calcium-binding protein 1 [Trichinella murrelli]|uniref:Sparc-related modular calcium-binding protein 1 n=1 Tax=Trichinella murrelli TaxID=144512 RepID=A0A0V0UAD9_9BILA|nr:Sparc-related modular calcium-binding protein 1 [Trichinella murrelli]
MLIKEKTFSSCNADVICTSDTLPMDPVCGTDGRTYNSKCEVKRVECLGSPVQVKHQGPCSDEDVGFEEKGRCLLERAFQNNLAASKNVTTLFIPECEPDGSFSSVQCHKSTGYCWCVTTAGKPIPGTSTQFKKPMCLAQGKVGRRSSKNGQGQKRRECSTANRSIFTNNLIKLFQMQYEREEHAKERHFSDVSVINQPARKIIDWKFNRLDLNRDGKISAQEMRNLRRMVHSAIIQPTSCADRFPKYCDLDHDRKISRSEWAVCMGVDINRISLNVIRVAFRLLLTLNKNKQHGLMMMMDERETISSPVNGLQAASLWASSNAAAGNGFGLREKSSQNAIADTQEEEKTDCKSQRQKALEDHKKTPTSGIYIPVCKGENDRLFQQVQCHKLTGFCWCAEPESGKPIPNTSARNARPVCDQNEKTALKIRGCNSKKLHRFLQRLFGTLESSMIASGFSEFSEEMSRREMALRWKFIDLDRNKNGKLEKQEWKHYRIVLKQWKGLRKCGRNFFRSCDGNSDSHLTLKEWISCTLGLYESRKTTAASSRGPNPFIHVLDPNQ